MFKSKIMMVDFLREIPKAIVKLLVSFIIATVSVAIIVGIFIIIIYSIKGLIVGTTYYLPWSFGFWLLVGVFTTGIFTDGWRN